MKHKPRILLDLLAFDPRDGGFATAIKDLLSSCQYIEGIEFVILCHQRHKAYFSSFAFENISVNFPYKMRFFASLLLLPFYCWKAKADAVHCEISALPTKVGVPGSVTVHDLDFMNNTDASPRTLQGSVMQFYWRHIYVRSLRRARIIKAISQATAAEIHRHVTDPRPIKVVYPFVQIPARKDHQRNWPNDSQPVRLLFLGSIVPRRNLPFLLRALPQFQHCWQLDVIGAMWWGENDMGRMIGDHRVSFHGYVSDAERARFLAECHILISPSRCEGFGYPVAEAMANGMLVLTSDIDVFREYVPAPLRFSLDDPANLANCFNRFDVQTYDRFRQLCCRAVEHLNFKANIASHSKLFHRLLESSRTEVGVGHESE
jgi:glycosyltransferase involved in cell wall biosynthesis